MCTVTIVPLCDSTDRKGTGFRLACNRDESRRRPAALPPCVRRFADRRAVMPIDPVSDGTWIAVNDRGLVMTLLNVYDRPVRPVNPGSQQNPIRKDSPASNLNPRHRPLSRGTIIPRLLHHDDVSRAAQDASALDPESYPPFRLIMADRQQVAELRSDSSAFRLDVKPIGSSPWMFTSSGLGDEVVEPPRRQLFEEMLQSCGEGATIQDAYHRHQWPDRTSISVCMSRPESRTVSYSVVEVGPAGCRLVYIPEAPNSNAVPIGVTLQT